MKKWLLGIVLALGMAVAFRPVTVWADNAFYVDSNVGTSSGNTYKTLNEAITAAGTTKTTIHLLSDIDESASYSFDGNGINVTIDLNGHTITGRGYFHSGSNCRSILFGVYRGAILTIDDYSTKKEGKVVGTGNQMRCVELAYSGATFNLNAGTIDSFSTSGINASWTGGGVECYSNGIFNMYGGKIVNCSTSGTGGGVDLNGSSIVFNMYGGTIDGCTSGTGAGIAVRAGASANLYSGTVTDCSATTTGGGVYYDNGSVTIGGTAVITGNTANGATDNVYLTSGKLISIGSGEYAPKSGMSVGMKTTGAGTFTSDGQEGYIEYFSSDNSDMAVSYTIPGKALQLSAAKEITYKDQGEKSFSGTLVSGAPTKYGVDGETPLKGATKDGYSFAGWFADSECSGDVITSIIGSEHPDGITLYAKWEVKKEEPKEEPKSEPHVEADTYKSSLPSKSLISNTVIDLKQTYELKAHEMSDRDTFNQSLLVFYNAALHGKKAKIIANYGIFPNRNLKVSENGLMQIITWSNLDYKIPGNVYAVCYNQTDGAYVISGTIDERGTAKLMNYKLRPATNITLYVEN